VESPRLTRRGEAQRISDEFGRARAGKLTTVDDVSPLRQRLLSLCISSEGTIDFHGIEALSTFVDLRTALELEAIACARGDARHDFQEWYPKYAELRKKHRAQGQDSTALDEVDPTVVAAELAMTKQAIKETEEMLGEHRLAVVERRPSPYSDTDIDGMHSVLESMRMNLVALEAAAQDDGRELEPLVAVGPVQSGTLRGTVPRG
jgi:hypothetical protein